MADVSQETLDAVEDIFKLLEDMQMDIVSLLEDIHAVLLKGFKDITDILKSNNDAVIDALESIDSNISLSGSGTEATKELSPYEQFKGAVKEFLQPFRDIYNVVAKIYTKITRWIQGNIEFGRSISQLNAQLASTFAISDIKKIFRDIRYGQLTSASTTALVQAVDDVKDAVVPIKALFINLFNYTAAAAINALLKMRQALLGLLEGLGKILEVIPGFKELKDKILEELNKKKDIVFPIQTLIDDAANGNFNRHREAAFR